MCGIFGYIGPKDAVSLVVDGISSLEYRGYDSSGIAALINGKLHVEKKVGKVSALKEALAKNPWKEAHVAISHTRWATHGRATEINAHPHLDVKKELALVHNGIIENYDAIKRLLEKRGATFLSDTDTEVVSQLIGFLYKGDFLKAVQRALYLLRGTFAFAVVHEKHPGQIICASNEAPLCIGIGKGEMYLSSDSHAFLKYTKKALYLRSGEVAVINSETVEVFDAHFAKVAREGQDLNIDVCETTKGTYDHFMLKEIFEQPQSVRYALLSRYSQDYGTAILEDLKMSDEELLNIKKIVIVACGTSYHAGVVGAYMLEEQARIPTQVEISSEFRYKNPVISENTLAIAISQSGETADTLAAMRELKAKGAKVLGICNVQGSSLARDADSTLFLRAGPEVGVASTKAFSGQLVILSLLALRLARMRGMSAAKGIEFIDALTKIPEQIGAILANTSPIELAAKKYAHFNDLFFLGRHFMFPTALEGALKLKEIAYVNANGYPAGELKHGPIALISEEMPTVAFMCNKATYTKMMGSLMEIKARGGPILAIAFEGDAEVKKFADDVIFVPKTSDEFAPILATVASQLFAYCYARERGTEIDKPRNLAKSVTVE